MGVGGQRHAPAALPPEKRTATYCTEGLGGLEGSVWTGAENRDPPGFDPRTVQPVASSYAIPTYSLLNS